jgi:hypothetical protein
MHRARDVNSFTVAWLILFSLSGCGYPKQQWKEYTEKVKHMAEEPKTAEGKCQRQGGILYNGQCYAPSTNGPLLDEATCHMRGGLYIDDRCLVAPKGRSPS